jgi:acyl-CoA thioester hydrolase
MSKKIKTLQEFLSYSPAVVRGKSSISSLLFYLKNLLFHLLVSVKWGDMDSFKHVNNTMYFRYQEASRGVLFHETLKKVQDPGFDIDAWKAGTGIGPILAHTFCSFKFPVSYPDNLLVGSVIHPQDISHDRMKVTHTIWSLKHQRMAAEGDATVVCYDFQKGQVANLPEAFKKSIADLHQGNSFHQFESFESINDFQSEF